MKKTIIAILLMIMIILPVVADVQSGPTVGTMTDNSLVFKGYYQGPVDNTPTEDSNITLEFKDYSETVINHAAQQGTSGTTITADNSRHVGENTGTIFTWSMKGTTSNTVHLNFSFSTMQAEVNGKYYVPAYSIVMSQNVTKKITEVTVKRGNNNPTTQTPTEANYNSDSFYSSVNKTITNITSRPANASSSEILTIYSGEFSGSVSTTDGTKWGATSQTTTESSGWFSQTTVVTTTTISWYRSGTCTLNISDYETEMPGSYRYVCWVIAELTIE